MKVDIIQTSFTGGEFSPSLLGRTDIAQYDNACATVENMLPRSYGPAISMPGTRYVATVSDSTLRTRLIPFVFNRTDAYAIEMGDLYMRFFTDRGSVVTPSGTEDLSAFGADLIAHWKMNDNVGGTGTTTVLDAVGSHNGTASTVTSTLSTTAIVSTGFDLNGLYYVSVADHANFTRTSSTQPFSVAGWFYFEPNAGSPQQVLFSKWNNNTTQYEYYCHAYNTTGNFSMVFEDIAASSDTSTYISDTPLQDGWNFVAIVMQGDGTGSTDCKIYLNGVATGVTHQLQAGYVKMGDTTAPFLIGSFNNGGNIWQSKIDNVAFFHIALTSAQVSSLYITTSTYQITTVFRANEVFDVHLTQLNDIIYLAHPNHLPQKLVRTSANEWTISDSPITGGPFLDSNTNTSTTLSVSATQGTINVTAATGKIVFTLSSSTLGHHNAFFAIGGNTVETSSTTGLKEVAYVKITHVINSYTATATVIKNIPAVTATSNWAEGAWSAVRGYPARVSFHDARLWFARTNHEPQKAWASKIDQYENFALDTQADDDALNLPLASNESNEIQWLASGRNMVAGTYGGAFVISSGGDDVTITPDNANANEEIGIGSEDIQPKRIGNLFYYIQRFGKKLRELFYFWDLDSYKATDRTILSPHILGNGVVDMDVQQNPETILYCVLTNGTLATMTRETDQEVTAWARHTTAGTYTSIAVIPSQSENYDEAWVIVERWINGSQKKYVEFFENIDVPDRQDKCLYLHSALSFDAYESTSTSAVTISLSASSGSVTLTSSSAYFVNAHVNRTIRAINAAGTTVGEGTITATASTTSITLSITTTFSALSYTAGLWGMSVRSVSGLGHLDAKTVGILADGLVDSLTKTVASATVTLASLSFVVHVGLSYDQIIFTLPKEAGTNRGTAQGKMQRFNEINLKLNRSTQGFKYGPDASNLDDINLAFTPTVTSLYTGILPPQGGGITMRGGYTRGAQIYLKNSNPLPIEILSIIGSLDTNEK